MTSDQILDALLRDAGEHFQAVVRNAYEAGKKAGEAAAKERVLHALEGDKRPLRVEEPRHVTAMAVAGASRPVRNALCMMEIGPDGATIQEITDFIHRWPSGQNI